MKELSYIFYSYPPVPGHYVSKDSLELEKLLKNTERRITASLRRLENLLPYGPYLIINTTQNKFVLRNRKGVIREGICSTGSYVLLDAGDGKQWMFKTPKGMFPILGKIVDPIWNKPDWAFVEESLPIPPRNHPDRLEYGTLGDYALTLGDGYLIHGTLYQRFLGLPVTHGCVRLGDQDLEVVFKNLNVGSRVYIF
ncbi:MAG TPA: L,D-transpeptidase [Rikenellaceae bacterium]|nr:L,D-transpeptidase [Rikenellaceae bacterium]HCV15004.1 L,D-transpeptidase [Rikenellaceae bacterium]